MFLKCLFRFEILLDYNESFAKYTKFNQFKNIKNLSDLSVAKHMHMTRVQFLSNYNAR